MDENSIEFYINGIKISQDVGCIASYISPFNKIDVKLTLADYAISYCEVRVTEVDADYDIGVGNLPLKTLPVNQTDPLNHAVWVGLRANYTHNLSFYITPEGFPITEPGRKTFRVSLYAKNELDGSWNVSYLVFTLDGAQLLLADGTALGVLTTREIPAQ
jgi:hypothetical protein